MHASARRTALRALARGVSSSASTNACATRTNATAFLASLDADLTAVACAGKATGVKTVTVPPRQTIGPAWDATRLKELQAWFHWGALGVVDCADYPNVSLTPYLWVYTR